MVSRSCAHDRRSFRLRRFVSLRVLMCVGTMRGTRIRRNFMYVIWNGWFCVSCFCFRVFFPRLFIDHEPQPPSWCWKWRGMVTPGGKCGTVLGTGFWLPSNKLISAPNKSIYIRIAAWFRPSQKLASKQTENYSPKGIASEEWTKGKKTLNGPAIIRLRETRRAHCAVETDESFGVHFTLLHSDYCTIN